MKKGDIIRNLNGGIWVCTTLATVFLLQGMGAATGWIMTAMAVQISAGVICDWMITKVLNVTPDEMTEA